MAEVFSKANLLSLDRQCISISPFQKSGVSSSSSSSSSSLLRLESSGFRGKRLVVRKDERVPKSGISRPQLYTINSQMKVGIGKAQKWWEKGLKGNMTEVGSAEELVDSLKNAGDKLVVLAFFSPSCGGCKALHPKICQLAEMNPDVQFLQVNHEDHKSMCYSLNVHVLPFFRFYKGSHGRVCSFSCTNATIKKFKDALAKYGPGSCSLGAAKGLEEKELEALAANKDLCFSYTPTPTPTPTTSEPMEVPVPVFHDVEDSEDKTLVASER